MKRVAILVAAIAFTVSINIKVFATGVENLNNTEVNQTIVGAETTSENTTNEAEKDVDNTSTDTNINKDTGIMPDSIFYFFDKAFDNIRLFFTFDDEKKIEILSQIADERLAESEIMTQEEKYDLAKSTIEEFNSLITKATDELNVLVEENNNIILNQDKEMGNNEVDLEQGEIKLDDDEGDKLGDFEENILSKQLKSIVVLKKLSDKLEGNAKEAIEAVIEMQLAKKEAVANMVEKRHELNAVRQEYQLVKNDLKQAKKSGDEEAIKAAEEVLNEKQNLYKDAKEEFKIAFEAKKEVKNDLKKSVEKAEKKKIENKEEQENKLEEDKKVDGDDKLTKQMSSEEVTEQAKVISTEEKVEKDENKNRARNTEVKKVEEDKREKEEHKRVEEDRREKEEHKRVEEAKKVKVEAVKKAEEVRKETNQKLENKERRYENIKEKDKKIKEEIKEKVSKNKEKEKKENN